MNATEPPLSAWPFASMDSERDLLGMLLTDQRIIPDAMAVCPPDALHWPHHRALYSLMVGMYEGGQHVDAGTVNERIGQRFDQYGGPAYESSLILRIESTANAVSHHAKRLAECRMRREAYHAARRAMVALADPTQPTGDVFAGLVSAMEAAESSGSDERWATLGEGAREAVENIATVRRGESDRLGMPLPWASTVPLMPLLLRGSLGIIGGHTGHGKSSSARSIAKTVGEYGYGAIVYSLEMSPAQFAEGVLSTHSDVSIRDVRRHVTHDDPDDARRWQEIQEAAGQVEALPIWICRDSQLSPRDIVARTHASTRKMRRKGIEPGLVVIDYLQLLDVDGADDNRANALSNAVRSFKLMARALDLPVVLLSGTNNNVSKREDKAPLLSDLEGSGGIARHADWVAFPNRDSLWDASAEEHEASMIWIKNRFGPLGAARLHWSGRTTTFRDRADAFRLIR